jgi:phosphoribosylformylglycinamidine (FGAM) synthase-like enzyme
MLATGERTEEQRLRAHGLLPAEFAYIVARLGREPNNVELGMLGAMWSEHCGYKHSRKLLKLLPTSGPRVLQGPGENAGAVDIGDGLAVVLKMESHNHPSAVEPFQGAATGVGGILRDIFTMGARPVALLDSLRFGDPAEPRTEYLVGGVIGGIAHYGNCIGVATVGGEISFDAGYTGNPIVNAMCVGVVAIERLTRAAASGPGNVLLLVGADTGRDGLQGAAFASNEDPEVSHRGVVQVGNPFLEKLLLEACLAVLETGDVLAMQDLGAAGLTSSAVEMAARGGLGVEIDVRRVPRRERGLGPFEVMLSESQERMLLLVRRGAEEAVQGHFARWELHAAVVGQVTADGQIRVRDGDDTVADLPIPLLTDEVFAYELNVEAPSTAAAYASASARGVDVATSDGVGGVGIATSDGVGSVGVATSDGVGGAGIATSDGARGVDETASDGVGRADETASVASGGVDETASVGSGAVHATGARSSAAGDTMGAALLRLLCSPNLRSRRFAFRQYDSTVQGNTVLGPGHAAAVIRVDGTRKGLAMTTDCNPRYMRADPRRGAAQAVAEAARNLACVGALPIAVTDCLNFGNPEKPGVAWQLTEAIHGLAEACRALDVPIVSGNVSLYNETSGRAIPPTPTVGMVGLLEDVSLAVPTGFAADCMVILLGMAPTALGASEYVGDGQFPRFDLDDERRLGGLLRALAARRVLRSTQDVSDGGLAVALAECAMIGGVGARLDVVDVSEVALFSEDQGRAIITCGAEDVAAVLALAGQHSVPAQVAGTTGGDHLTLGDELSVSLTALREAWEGSA